MPKIPNSNYKVTLVDLSDDTTVTASGGINTQTLQPPAGKIYEIMQVHYSAPGTSTSGDHNLEITFNDGAADRRIGFLETAYGNNLKIEYSTFIAGGTKEPANAREQVHLFTGGMLIASNDHPLKFIYTNDTGVNQTGTRVLALIVREIIEAI